jgi:hypothetical protein
VRVADIFSEKRIKNTRHMKSIKDLIYFDVSKAQSLISQLNKGLVSEIMRAVEDENEINSGFGVNLKIVQANLGGKEREKTIKTEKITLFHEVLNEIESSLEKTSSLTDINSFFESKSLSFNDFLEHLKTFNYIKAQGWAIFEDHSRRKRIASNFNEVQRFIFTASLSNNKELQSLKNQLSQKKKELAKEPDRNKKSKDLNHLKQIETKLDSILEENTDAKMLDEEFVKGMKIFLDTFAQDRLTFRLVPFDLFNEFQILAHLKSKYIIDGDFESIIYTYGARPNVKITTFGIITSCPSAEDNRIDPSDEFRYLDEKELKPEQIFDKAFRHVFSTFEGFDKFFHVPIYPKVAISPIAIYREVNLEK